MSLEAGHDLQRLLRRHRRLVGAFLGQGGVDVGNCGQPDRILELPGAQTVRVAAAIEFLVVMGLLVPPIAGVYLSDFFIFRRRDFSESHLDARPALRVSAVAVALGTGLASAWMFYTDSSITSIGALDSLAMSIIVYCAIEFALGARPLEVTG